MASRVGLAIFFLNQERSHSFLTCELQWRAREVRELRKNPMHPSFYCCLWRVKYLVPVYCRCSYYAMSNLPGIYTTRVYIYILYREWRTTHFRSQNITIFARSKHHESHTQARAGMTLLDGMFDSTPAKYASILFSRNKKHMHESSGKIDSR